jgi:CAAX prenyl protease-like protein
MGRLGPVTIDRNNCTGAGGRRAFFRGYLLDRFSHNGGVIRAIGFLLSTALFAVMHQRWALAGFAGLVYGLVYLRSQRITDAILAHSASNAIIGFYALATAQWSLI